MNVASGWRIHQNRVLAEYVAPKIRKGWSVLNVGETQDQYDRGLIIKGKPKLYRDYFKGAKYYTLDKYNTFGEHNHFSMDAMDVHLLEKEFDLVIVMNLLEHIEKPWELAKRITVVVKRYLFVSSPFIFQRHEDDVSGDYWRFTERGLITLFPQLKVVKIYCAGSDIDEDGWKDSPAGYSILMKK